MQPRKTLFMKWEAKKKPNTGFLFVDGGSQGFDKAGLSEISLATP
jgi:hypothetical protein